VSDSVASHSAVGSRELIVSSSQCVTYNPELAVGAEIAAESIRGEYRRESNSDGDRDRKSTKL
jgi:hypothetical protein